MNEEAVIAYVQGTRDSEEESRIVKYLNTLKKADRNMLLEKVLPINPIVGLVFVRKCVNDRPSLTKFFVDAIGTRDISEMKFWFETIGGKLKLSDFESAIMEAERNDAAKTRQALYWAPRLPYFTNGENVSTLANFKRMHAENS